jgi:hypothetical protein
MQVFLPSYNLQLHLLKNTIAIVYLPLVAVKEAV